MSNKQLTTQDLDEALAEFRKEALELMASGESLEAVVLGANTKNRVLQLARCESPGELVYTVAHIFTSQAARVLNHVENREELVKGLLRNVEEQIRDQLS